MAKSKQVTVGVPKQTKARLPSKEVMVGKLKAANLMTGTAARGKQAEKNRMLTEFATLLGSRPAGTRHVSRLVVDWTRVVEMRLGTGSELPLEKDGKPLFEHVVKTLLSPEITISAVAAYNALYGA